MINNLFYWSADKNEINHQLFFYYYITGKFYYYIIILRAYWKSAMMSVVPYLKIIIVNTFLHMTSVHHSHT